jgi:uncharacterized lipoprotein YbaY
MEGAPDMQKRLQAMFVTALAAVLLAACAKTAEDVSASAPTPAAATTETTQGTGGTTTTFPSSPAAAPQEPAKPPG